MSQINNLIIPFFLGGIVMAGVKFVSTHINNTGLAAIIGGLPTGLLAIYFVSDQKSLGYAHNYFYVTLSLLIAILVFYFVHRYTKISKNIVLLISILTWASLVGIHYFLSQDEYNK